MVCVTALAGVPAFVRQAFGERTLRYANHAAMLDIDAIEDQDCFIPHSILTTYMDEVLAEPHCVLGNQVTVGASIGIALAPKDGCDPEALMKNADLALYSSKNSGRSTYAFCP